MKNYHAVCLHSAAKILHSLFFILHLIPIFEATKSKKNSTYAE